MEFIRTAREDELAAIRELDAGCFPADSLDLEPAAPGELEHGLATGAIRVVEADGRLAAFLQTEWTAPDRCWIDVLGVLPAYRRRGFGGALLDDFLTRDFTSAVGAAELVTSPRNRPMLALVTSRGFGAYEVKSDFFGPGKVRLLCRLPCPAGLPNAPVRQVEAAEEVCELLASGEWTLRGITMIDGALRYDVHRDRLQTVAAFEAYARPTSSAAD